MSAVKLLPHEIAVELLPWLVNNSLVEDEREAVLEHARACVICRRELGALEQVRDSISQTSGALPIPAPDMRNINTRIDAWINRQSWVRNLWLRIGDSIEGSWRIAIAAQSILILVLASVLLWPVSENQEFTTLTQPDNLPDGRYVRLVFNPELAESEFSNLLDTFQLRLVEGPSARGVYTLGLVESLSVEDRENLMVSLQQDPRVIFAQPVKSGSGQ